MPLAIGVRAGDKIYLGDSPLEVVHIGHETGTVRFEGRQYTVYEDQATLLQGTEVKISLGRNRRDIARILFTAPHHVKILREKLYASGKS